MIGRAGTEPGRRERVRRCGHVEHHRPRPRRQAVADNVLGADPRQLGIDLDQRDRDLADAHRERQPGCTHAGAEIDNAVAAPRTGSRSQQDRIVPEPVTASFLRQPQPPAEHRIVGTFIRVTCRPQLMG